ncbi:GNAT family N-acetyltransferase [Flavobacteriaceae bacterium F89]|uniref:GNAT family N-acetyltransferase n=1 Tax=Cerina litoralis TaxID=2874477 RepID=A0AAE3EYP5_9FLAO|nr:GNAT family N-acetyltransferase [Cerina litoralis]MCG2462006.1 GNAT family N-acetyltransferase [Cerina litoralis]
MENMGENNSPAKLPVQIRQSRRVSAFQRYRDVIKNGMFLFGVKNRLERLGIEIMPYYWVGEGMEDCTEPGIKGDISEFTLINLSLEEIKMLWKDAGDRVLEGRVEEYRQCPYCVGLEHHGEIAAYMFIGFKDLNFKGKLFPLKENEAYLANMWTFHSFRGRNLAPYLRYKCYQLLKEQGRDTNYSITEYFNKSSIKFKNKLNAKNLNLFIYFNFFGKWQKHYLLKTYTD